MQAQTTKSSAPSSALQQQLQGYRLVTAEIVYRMPDHPAILQTFIWQQYDMAPSYPELKKFLEFWTKNLDGPLHSVRVDQVDLVGPTRYRPAAYFNIH